MNCAREREDCNFGGWQLTKSSRSTQNPFNAELAMYCPVDEIATYQQSAVSVPTAAGCCCPVASTATGWVEQTSCRAGVAPAVVQRLSTADFFTNYFISGRRIVSKNEPSTYLRRDSSNRTDATGILPTGVFGNGSIDFQSLTIDRLPTPETTKTS